MSELEHILADHILGPAHVGFVVADLDRALAGARAVYGLREQDIEAIGEPGQDVPTRFAFFSIGGLRFEYIEPVDESSRARLLQMPSGGGGINHLAWRVRDIDGALALLARRGIRPGHVTPEGVVRIGRRKMVYLDPATTSGLVIELIEFPEAADGD